MTTRELTKMERLEREAWHDGKQVVVRMDSVRREFDTEPIAPPPDRPETMTAGRTIETAPNTFYHEFGAEYTDGARVTVGWSEEDAAWIARVFGCAHDGACLADGPTKEVALLALATAMGATLDCIEDERSKEAAEKERLYAALEAVKAENATLREELQDALSTQAVYKGHALEARSSLAEAQKDCKRMDWLEVLGVDALVGLVAPDLPPTLRASIDAEMARAARLSGEEEHNA